MTKDEVHLTGHSALPLIDVENSLHEVIKLSGSENLKIFSILGANSFATSIFIEI